MATVSQKITIEAPKDKVYAALTTAEGLQEWFAPKLEGEVDPGKEMTFHFNDGETFRWKTTEASPGSTVRWECLEGPGQAAGTKVIFRLSDKGEGQTTVECDHEGWPEDHEVIKTCNTLWGISMGHLKTYAEGGKLVAALH